MASSCQTVAQLPCINLDELQQKKNIVGSDQFVAALSQQLGRVGETFVCKVAAAKSQLATLESQVDAFVTTTESSGSRSALAKQLELFAVNQVDTLRFYVVLNVLTALKSLKTQDDKATEAGQREFLDQLSHEPWFMSSGMHSLCNDTLTVARRLFQHDAPLETPPPTETCAFCLDSLSNPVKLACSHQFCWSCLTNAAHKRLDHCPLCRTQNSLDPRDFILRPILADLTNAHFTTSTPATTDPSVEQLRSKLMSSSPILASTRERQQQQEPAANIARLNPKAKEFVPISPILNPTSPSLNSPSSALHDLVSLTLGSAATAKPDRQSPREASKEDKTEIAKLRGESNERIKYSFKQLLAMRPLNPNAPTYQPLWMLGIHTPSDLRGALTVPTC